MLYRELVNNCNYGGFNPVFFGYEYCAPKHSFGPFVRSNWVMHYVVSGYGKFIREGVTYNIEPNQIFVIPPQIETYYEADSEKPWHYIWIGFNCDETTQDSFTEAVFTCTNAGEIFNKMLSCSNKRGGKSAFLASCLWELVANMLNGGKDKNDYVDKAISFMQSEYSSNISIKEIADEIGIDRKYLSRIFTKKMNISPSQYLINLRLNKAKELMLDFDKTPTTAAYSTGYNDIYGFSKAFKKHFGLSPREFKNRNKKP